MSGSCSAYPEGDPGGPSPCGHSLKRASLGGDCVCRAVLRRSAALRIGSVPPWQRPSIQGTLRHGDSCAAAPQTPIPLYPVVQHHPETFLTQAVETHPLGTGVPFWMEKDFRAYLRCGILAHGFARARCVDCGHERLIRYCARPLFALERLHAPKGVASLNSPDARLLYRFPKPTPDGRTHILLSPVQFLERLAKFVPPPRVHRNRYHGVLAPNAKPRAAVRCSRCSARLVVAQRGSSLLASRLASFYRAFQDQRAVVLPIPPFGRFDAFSDRHDEGGSPVLLVC